MNDRTATMTARPTATGPAATGPTATGQTGIAAGTDRCGPAGADAAAIVRGCARLFDDLDCRVLTELPLANGRRADLVALDRRGWIAIVEVKASLADFRADQKWPEYRAFCDTLWFAVGPAFPRDVLPADTGILVADGYAGAVVRPAPEHPLNAARRKAMTLRFARAAAARLRLLLDPAAPYRA